MKKRGFSLAMVLALVALLASLAAVMTGLFTVNLNLLQASNNGQFAVAEAEAGLYEVMVNLAADPNYGCANETIQRSENIDVGPKDCYHVVTFDRTRTDFGFSVNAKGGAAQGYGNRAVPNSCVHVISTGYCKGQYRSVEALIEQPPFNYAIASESPINSLTPLRVEGTTSKQAFLSNGKPLEGHLISNHSGGISVAGSGPLKSFISGFARSAGGVQLDPGGVARLGLRPNSGTIKMPNVDVNSYDNLSLPNVKSISTPNCNLTTIDKAYRATQDTNFTERTQLNNGYIYVKGNTTFQKGLAGSGAIVVDGDLTIQGAGSTLKANDSLAILATGKLTIKGDSSNTVDAGSIGTGQATANYFSGLVYAGKGVDLENLTVAGVVLSKDPNANSNLKNTNFLFSPEAGNVSFTVPGEIQMTQGGAPDIYVGSVVNGQFVRATDPYDPQATIFIGPPPGVDYLSLIQDPKNAFNHPNPNFDMHAFLDNAQTNNGNLQLGTLQLGSLSIFSTTDPGYNEAQAMSQLKPGDNGYQAAMTDLVKAMAKGSPGGYTPQVLTVTPGSSFNLSLNTFLPRSSTLHLASYSLRSGKI